MQVKFDSVLLCLYIQCNLVIFNLDKSILLNNSQVKFCKFHSSFHLNKDSFYVQHYVIKFVSDLRQVGGFLQVLRFPPPKVTSSVPFNFDTVRFYLINGVMVKLSCLPRLWEILCLNPGWVKPKIMKLLFAASLLSTHSFKIMRSATCLAAYLLFQFVNTIKIQLSMLIQYKENMYIIVLLSLSRFPPAAASFILQQFSQYGNIVKHVVRLLIITIKQNIHHMVRLLITLF